MDSPLFLHMQHHSTIITLIFLKLSKVNIFHKTADHMKNTTLEEALTLNIFLQGKKGSISTS
jgi:hypothetical protein